MIIVYVLLVVGGFLPPHVGKALDMYFATKQQCEDFKDNYVPDSMNLTYFCQEVVLPTEETK